MICAHCKEEILEGERAFTFGEDLHHECAVRLAVGSVGHIMRRCSCYGGTEEDPPDMTTRQAARAAVEALRESDETGRRMVKLFDMIRDGTPSGKI